MTEKDICPDCEGRLDENDECSNADCESSPYYEGKSEEDEEEDADE
jgi:hypothetical protein